MADENPAPNTERRTGGVRDIRRWGVHFLIYVVAVFLVVALVRVFLVQSFRVPSGSMEHTLQNNDTLLAWEPGDPERGMIVVFRDDLGWLDPAPPAPEWKRVLSWVQLVPNPDEQYVVKRLIGLPGDHVSCCDAGGRLSVNGHTLNESSYLYYTNAASAQRPFDLVVPAGQIFVLGDHRDDSADSRYHLCRGDAYAFPSLDSIQGKAVAIMRPLSRAQWFSIPSTFADVPRPAGSPPDPDQAAGTCT